MLVISSKSQDCCHNGDDNGIPDYDRVIPVGIVVVLGGYSFILDLARFLRGSSLSFIIILSDRSLPFLVIFGRGLR